MCNSSDGSAALHSGVSPPWRQDPLDSAGLESSDGQQGHHGYIRPRPQQPDDRTDRGPVPPPQATQLCQQL